MSDLLGGIEAGGTKVVCAAARGREVVAETIIATTTPAATLDAVLRFLAGVTLEHGPFGGIGIAAKKGLHVVVGGTGTVHVLYV